MTLGEMPRNPAQERRRHRADALKKQLLRMATDHFFSIFEDEGWQDTMEELVGELPGCPDPEHDDEFFEFYVAREGDLIPDMLAAIMREELRKEVEDVQKKREREISRTIARNARRWGRS